MLRFSRKFHFFEPPGTLARPAAIAAALFAASLFAQAAYATPLISEVLYDAVGSDDGKVFVEIFGSPGTLLDGMTLEGVNGSNGAVGPVITLSGVIPADGLFVVADRTSAGASDVAEADLLANFDFQNGPDSVVLRLGEQVLDALAYGVFAPGEFFAGEGGSAEDPPAGWSLARAFADIDSDDNGADFVALDSPTPGAAEIFVVPEPSVALLFWSGLAVLSVRRRPRR